MVKIENIADTEIRKLSIRQIHGLIEILEYNNDWMKLMNEIRSDYFNFQDERRKYNISDTNAISNARHQFHRTCTEIFLDEWGTSGDRRPTVRLLHQYLKKANLIRAMTFVAENLLEETDSEVPLSPSFESDKTLETVGESIREKSTFPIGGDGPTDEVISYAGVTKISYRRLENITNHFDEKLQIGHGAFGSVYKGKADNREIAVKKLNRDATEHFQHELLILLTGIKHRNLLPPLAMSDENNLCLVYEFMPNGSLEDRLALKNPELEPLSWKKRLSISINICDGLKYLHEQPRPIIHRDIKSSNILLDENDMARIGDFGLIRIKNDNQTVNTTLVQGSTAYMAPEYFRGVLSAKLDVYSFGVVLLELLTGSPSLTPDGHLVEYLDEKVDPDEGIRPHLDRRAGQWDVSIANMLYDLAKLCLEEKKKRPTTMEVMQTLNQIIN